MAGKSNKKANIKKLHDWAKSIPGFDSKVSPGRAVARYKDIMFHSKVEELRKKSEKNPGGHLMWDKKPGSTAFPKRGKKK